MKQLILLFSFLLLCTCASATHLAGGYITYKSDKGANPNPRKFYFTLNLITNHASPAEDPFVRVNMGDGAVVEVNRKKVAPINGSTDLETFEWEHTFPADGQYTVSWTGENRDNNILNLPAPSEQSIMAIQTSLNINSLRGLNSSPILLAPDRIKATVGQPLAYNLLAHDADGDSLAFKLVTPSHINSQHTFASIPGYSLPHNTFSCNNATGTAAAQFNLHPAHGQITWNAPCIAGQYILAIVIEEWRRSPIGTPTMLGSITYDISVGVSDAEKHAIKLLDKEKLTLTSDGIVVASANQELELKFYYENSVPAPAPLPDNAKAPFILLASELSQVYNAAVAYTVESTSTGSIGTFRFTPGRELIRSRPYYISLYSSVAADKNHHTVQASSFGILIEGNQPKFSLVEKGELELTEEGYVQVAPDKPLKLKIFAENLPGYLTSLSTESSLATGAKVFNFTARDSADGVVGELVFQPGEAQASKEPQTIRFIVTYNPARFAGQRIASSDAIVKEMQVHVVVAPAPAAVPTASADELEASRLLLYPNPAQESFKIDSDSKATLNVYTLQGKIVLSQPLRPGINEVQRPSTVSAGMYLYSIESQNRAKKAGKLVLQ